MKTTNTSDNAKSKVSNIKYGSPKDKLKLIKLERILKILFKDLPKRYKEFQVTRRDVVEKT